MGRFTFNRGAPAAAAPFGGRRKGAIAVAVAVLMTGATTAVAVPGNGNGNGPNPNPNPKAQIACSNTDPRPGRPPFCTAPTLAVGQAGGGLTEGKVTQLRMALGIDDEITVDDDGALRYMDPETFQAVPSISVPIADLVAGDEEAETATERQFLDVAALLELQVPDVGVVTTKVADALQEADLLPSTAGDAVVTHSTFSLEHNPDYLGGVADLGSLHPPTVPLLESIVGDTFEIDTQVNYPLSVDGIPIVGPGAKVKVSFAPPAGTDAEPEVSQLLFAAVDIAGLGRQVEVIPPSLHVSTCVAALEVPAGLDVTAELVYYAPELSAGVQEILPHLSCGVSGEHDGEEFLSRNVLIPAVVDAPTVTVSAGSSGATVGATAAITGGTPPYEVEWSSQQVTLDPADAGIGGTSIQYEVTTPDGGSVREELLAVVTDANGLTAIGRTTLDVEAVAADRVPVGGGSPGGDGGFSIQSHNTSPYQFGTEYVGVYNHQNDLAGTKPNAEGFWDVMRSMAGSYFFWGNNNVWERDFRDASTGGGGNDHNVADDVDIVFFTGHAGRNGWNLESKYGDDFVHYNDTRMGQTDLEWMVIGACGVLQDGSPSFASRWGATFKGLHMLLGYATVSNDTSQEGRQFAGYLNKGWKLYQAWGQQAINIQPSSVVYGYAGPVGYNGEWNAHDYFWGKGPVSADVTNVYYIWRTVGNA
jgi:hypothetical protein